MLCEYEKIICFVRQSSPSVLILKATKCPMYKLTNYNKRKWKEYGCMLRSLCARNLSLWKVMMYSIYGGRLWHER